VVSGIFWAPEAEDFANYYFRHDWINWIFIMDE
jgi:hypothetical protein